jgi:hypothetical protein
MIEENNDKKDDIVKSRIGFKLSIVMISIIMMLLFYYYKQQVIHPAKTPEVLTIEPQAIQKIDCPKVDCPVLTPPNNNSLILSANLLISVERGEDVTNLINELAPQIKDQSINDNIRLLSLLASSNISKLALFDQFNLIIQDAIKPIKINPIEFSSKMAQELLSKLIIVKRLDTIDHDSDLEKINEAKKYMLDNQMDQAIQVLDNMDNQNVKEWILKAKNKQQIDSYAKSIFNSICEQ